MRKHLLILILVIFSAVAISGSAAAANDTSKNSNQLAAASASDPLSVTSINPVDNATNVPNTARSINVTFNRPIQINSQYNGILVVDCAHNSFKSITNTVNGNVLTVTADSNWTSSVYRVYIYPNAVYDQNGNTLNTGFLSTFSNTNLTYGSTIPSSGTPGPCIILTFDDNFSSHYYTDMAYLSGKGLNPTLFINEGLFGSTGSITEDQVRAMAADGWLIANHTWDHADLSSLTEAEQELEIVKAQNWLLANTDGKGAYIFATPFGLANADTLTAMNNNGIIFCRGDLSMGSIWNPNLDNGTGTLLGLPAENFDTNTFPTDPAATMLAFIAQCMSNNQSIIIVIHHVTDTPQASSTDLSTTEFYKLIDGIVASKYRCINPYQWINEWKLNTSNPLTVNTVNPANNAANVALTAKTITVTFSSPVQAGNTYNNITVVNTSSSSNVSVTKSISGSTLTLTSPSNWVAGANYTLSIPVDAVTDANGNTLTSNFTSKFTAITAATPLTVTSINPASNTVLTVKGTSPSVVVTFSSPIQAGSAYSGIYLYNTQTRTYKAITKTIDGNTLTINVTAQWSLNSPYTLYIPVNAVTDAGGNALASNFTSKFTTSGLSVTSINPANNATGVAVTARTITITFNSPVQAGIYYRMISVVNTRNNTSVNMVKSISSSTLTLTTYSNWVSNTTYKVNIPANALSSLSTAFSSTFKTA